MKNSPTRKFAYDVWGDTVNIAARLESGGEMARINVSREVVEALADECRVEERGAVTAKNRGKIEMFFVVPKESKSGGNNVGHTRL